LNKLKRYKVTFTYNNRWSWQEKTTREIEVDCEDEYTAILLTAREFDFIKVDRKTRFMTPANRKIHIDKVEEIKEKKTKKDDKTT
jgi:hypothetical protein